MVNDKSNVLLIDSHSECNRCDHSLNLSTHPLFVNLNAMVVLKTSVVCSYFHISL